MKDFYISRSGDSLVEVSQSTNLFKLLVEHENVNIMLNRIAANSVVWITPGEDHRYLEFYMLLSGSIALTRKGNTQELKAGDSFYFVELDEDISITPHEDIELLCVTSKPVFGEFIDFINDLNDLNGQIERKDHYTFGHSRRVMRFAEAVGRHIKLNADDLHNLLLAALYHDVGKCYLSSEILNKPGFLTDTEYAAVRRHPADSAKLLKGRFSEEVTRIARSHHERLDGSGYPDGVGADQLDIPSRILAAVDAFDAMTSDRIYRKGRPIADAIAELQRFPHHYDEQIVAAMDELHHEGALEEIIRLDREGKLTGELHV